MNCGVIEQIGSGGSHNHVGWKDLVDEWVKSAGDVDAAAMAGSGPSRYMDHEGDELPSPPLDPGGLLASTRTASIEMSHFFDDLEDLSASSGPSPPSSNGVSDEVVNPSLNKREQQSWGPRSNSPDSRSPESKGRVVTSNGHVESRMGDGREIQWNGRKAIDIANGNDRLANGNSRVNSGPGLPVDRTVPLKTNGNGLVRKFETKPPVIKANEPKADNWKLQESQDISLAARIKAAKRRLHERYEQEIVRQRFVQAMDLTDLPKEGLPTQSELMHRQSQEVLIGHSHKCGDESGLSQCSLLIP